MNQHTEIQHVHKGTNWFVLVVVNLVKSVILFLVLRLDASH